MMRAHLAAFCWMVLGFVWLDFIGRCIFHLKQPICFLLCISLHLPFMSEDPPVQKWQASLSDMTHLALCSLPAEVFFYRGGPMAQDFHWLCRETHTLMHFFTNRKCFESAVGFLMAPRINSGEPARLSHMIQHPLINATQCCVTKSQLHHAPSDWSALTVVVGI